MSIKIQDGYYLGYDPSSYDNRYVALWVHDGQITQLGKPTARPVAEQDISLARAKANGRHHDTVLPITGLN